MVKKGTLTRVRNKFEDTDARVSCSDLSKSLKSHIPKSIENYNLEDKPLCDIVEKENSFIFKITVFPSDVSLNALRNDPKVTEAKFDDNNFVEIKFTIPYC